MKYLSNYTEDLTTELLDKTGAFFAFSQEQFDRAKTEGVEYVNMGAGLICPKGQTEFFDEQFKTIVENGIKQDIAENGIEAIIERELCNHEAYYVGEIEDTVDKLEGYGVSREQVIAVYRQNRHKHEED